jgi:putative zinc finger/helix-turn-helix YgiT family protein
MSAEVEVEADWCTNPEREHAIFDGVALKILSTARAELKAQVVRVLTPSEITAAREKLGLSQSVAGEVLGDGPMAFRNYESGKETVPVEMSNLLRVLRAHPEYLEILTRRQSAP